MTFLFPVDKLVHTIDKIFSVCYILTSNKFLAESFGEIFFSKPLRKKE